MSRLRETKGKSTEISGSVTNVAVNGGITMSAAGQINNSAVGGLSYGMYSHDAMQQNNPVPTVTWYDVLNKKLKATNKPINGQDYDNVVYGEQVRFEIKDSTQAHYSNGTDCIYIVRSEEVNLNFKSKDRNDLSLNVNCKVENGIVVSEVFTLPLYWYQDEYEEYDYTNKVTKTTRVLEIKVFDGLNSQGALDKSTLKPYTYFRNYEEIVGLFNVNNSGTRAQITNYENRFIDSHDDLKKEVDKFLDYLITENKTVSDIKTQVSTVGQKIWELANNRVKRKKAYLDDRPLYWTRNKISAYLKRHPLFKNDIDYDKSLVNVGSLLADTIKLFEEASRNYRVDFSKADKKNKKVLIIGFDPFYLDSIKHPKKKYCNILQSNPSGVAALVLNKTKIKDGFIQTLILPVRYTDFDSYQDNNGVHPGNGVIEEYIEPLITKVDIIISMSQFEYQQNNLDYIATVTRGGQEIDNLYYQRSDISKSITHSNEWLRTTLPITNIVNQGIIILKRDGTYKDSITNKYDDSKIFNLEVNGKYETIGNYDLKDTDQVYYGPGGNFLSNEVFYRIARIREMNNAQIPTGHLHTEKLQLSIINKEVLKITPQTNDDLDKNKTNSLLKDVIERYLEEAIINIKKVTI